MKAKTKKPVVVAVAAAKGACTVISSTKAAGMITLANGSLESQIKDGFILMPDRTQILPPDSPVGTWTMILCTRKKDGTLAKFAMSSNPDDFVLGDLFDNTGFSQAVMYLGQVLYFGAKS